VPPLRLTLKILFLLFLTAIAAFQARARPYLLVGWLWFLGTLVPVVGLVQVGQQARADRYTYVPLIGIFIALVWGIWEILPARRRGLGLAIASLVVLAPCVVLAREQVGHWRNSLALWEHALAVTSDNWMARAMYGEALITEGRDEEARLQLEEALRLRSDMDPALAQLGRLRQRQGRRQEALAYFRRAAAMRPDIKNYQQMIARLEAEIEASP
jgi:protein O-mannosyl-transferase